MLFNGRAYHRPGTLIAPIVLVLICVTHISAAQINPPYTEIFYKSGSLRIQGYIFKPIGDGPFPLIIYNHGSRDGQERAEQPFPFIARVLTPAGYAVLVPERRGYGKSDGEIFRNEVGTDTGAKFIHRLQAEADDVLAALEYAKSLPDIDTHRVGVMGWSLGGIVSVFAASRSIGFFAIVDQAGGSLTWNRSRALQSAMLDAAKTIRIPTLCMDAENDATTESVTRVCESVRNNGTAADLAIYAPFKPTQNLNNVAPGHLIFSGQGVAIWGRDLAVFFDKHRPL